MPQLLAMTLVEIPLYVANSYVGYTKLEASDVGQYLMVLVIS